jgi:hypothetical protein
VPVVANANATGTINNTAAATDNLNRTTEDSHPTDVTTPPGVREPAACHNAPAAAYSDSLVKVFGTYASVNPLFEFACQMLPKRSSARTPKSHCCTYCLAATFQQAEECVFLRCPCHCPATCICIVHFPCCHTRLNCIHVSQKPTQPRSLHMPILLPVSAAAVHDHQDGPHTASACWPAIQLQHRGDVFGSLTGCQGSGCTAKPSDSHWRFQLEV